MIKKGVSITFTASLGIALLGASFAFAHGSILTDEISQINETIDEKQQSIDQISRQIDSYQEKIDEQQAKEATLRGELDLLSNRIAKTELEITYADEEIDLVNEELRLVDSEIRDVEHQLEDQQEMIADVLREIQVVDNDLPLQTFLGTSSLAELFDELQRLETVSDDLHTAVEAAKASKVALSERREHEKTKREQLEDLQASLEDEIEQLAEEEGARELLVVQTQQSEAEFQLLLNQLRQEEAFINQQITLLQAEIEGKLLENDEIGDSSVLSWPFDPSGYGISAYFHDPTYPFRHLFEHSGVDLPAPVGTPIGSVAPGYVAWTRQGRLYGNYVMVIHSNGLASLYAHMSRIDVVPDQFVSRGQTIGAVGNTGLSTGPHLHFEIRKDGIPTNPLDYLISY